MESKPGSTIKRFLQGWGINTAAVLVASLLLPGISYDHDWRVLLLASLLLGVLNAFVRPILMLVALPVLIVTLGLFMLVINALLLMLVSGIVHGFEVRSFGWALLGAIIISFVSLVLNTFTGVNRSRIQVRRFGRKPPPSNRHDDGSGPVIDV
jgi:putative membrane protein